MPQRLLPGAVDRGTAEYLLSATIKLGISERHKGMSAAERRLTMNIYDATETAYKNGYKQGVKDAAKWISVKDRLPENREDVLVVAFWHERWNVQWGWYAPNGRVWHVGLMEETDYPVSHWMPLPEPPKGE
jgi:hypothetical protein